MRPPEFEAPSFNCPHCRAFAAMAWNVLWRHTDDWEQLSFWVAECGACKDFSFWEVKDNPDDWMEVNPRKLGDMVYPNVVAAPARHPDLPEACWEDYEEARQIAGLSPRGAAALLRLVVQKLCKELGKSGKNINEDIASLVKDGLPVRVKEALDIVRVSGNNAVHPGTLTRDDHAAQVNSLFMLVNIVVDQMITQPKHIAAMHAALPPSALEAIKRRDGG